MRYLSYIRGGVAGLGIVAESGEIRGLLSTDEGYPGSLGDIVGDRQKLAAAAAILGRARVVDPAEIRFAPPLARPGKIICVGLNYHDHATESGFERPQFPTVFARFPSSLIGHGEPLVCPSSSGQFDFEGEMVAVIGKPGRHISKANALDHVAGYSIFNDGSVRDIQLRTPQWTLGKNFDGTGAFGPYFVTADELPAGAAGLRLETVLNGTVVQSASTDEMIFDVAELVAIISSAMTLEVGDIIVSGTPSGIGHARTPPLYMAEGDRCEVRIEGIGILSNPILGEMSLAA